MNTAITRIIAAGILTSGIHAGGSAHAATTYSLTPEQGAVNFLAKGKPAMLKIEGKGKGVTGKLTEDGEKISGTLEFDLSTLDTGIGLRDEHMKDKYLETKKFKKAILTLKDQKVPGSGKFKFKGEMEIKGVKKDVEGEATVIRDGAKTRVSAQFPLKISDYPIGVPSYMGITVAETVEVTVNTEASKK